MKKLVSLIFASMFGLMVFVPVANAQTIAAQYADMQEQGLIFAGICDSADADCECRDHGVCDLDDILQLVVNLSVFVFGISGTVMLTIFIYGGLKWILARGDAGRVQEGTKAIFGAFIGLVIILGAYTAINVLVSILMTGDVTTTSIEETIGGSAGEVIETQE